MKKTFISFLAVALLMFGTSVFALTTSFPDVPEGVWFYEDVMNLASWDVIRGYPDGTFKPGNNANRAEIAAMLNRYNTHILGEQGILNDISLAKLNIGNLYYLQALGLVDTAAMYYNHAWNESIFKGYVFSVSCDQFDTLKDSAEGYLTEAKKYIEVSTEDENDILDQIGDYKDMCLEL